MDRKWWQDRLFEAGFREHPAARQILGDEAIEADHLQITVAHQKIPPAVLGR